VTPQRVAGALAVTAAPPALFALMFADVTSGQMAGAVLTSAAFALARDWLLFRARRA
jgi:hypothetical protein